MLLHPSINCQSKSTYFSPILQKNRIDKLQQSNIKVEMGLEIQSEIFKWLQNLRIVKQGKRTLTSAIEISQTATAKFFDGLYISHIVKVLLRDRGEEEAAVKLDSIKQNSTPAIRLYNWNILTQALKKLGYSLDYGEKSKLLNLQNEAVNKILGFLFGLKSEGHAEDVKKKLQIETNQVSKKNLKEAVNIFQFLVISIGKHFKLSVQHTLNLFLDNNKYLAHLLVKGVKGTYQPIYLLLNDLSQHLSFIIDSLFCIDQQESLHFFMNALKPCLISKDVDVAEACLNLLKELYEAYTIKGVNIKHAAQWMQTDGVNTLFFAVKRHPTLLQPIFSVLFAFVEQKLFLHIQPSQKSLLWSNQVEKIAFYKDFLVEGHKQLIYKFLQSPIFGQWNSYCMKASKRTKATQQLSLLISIFQYLWVNYLSIFQADQQNLPNFYVAFLKNCTLSSSQIVFTQSAKTLFHLMVYLGLAKDSFAPVIYKTLASSIGFQQKSDRIEFMILNFIQAYKQIPSLPGNLLAEPLLRIMQSFPSVSSIELAKLFLEGKKIGVPQAQDLLQALAKIFFFDIQLGPLATETMMIYFKNVEMDQLLGHYCKASLAHFYSVSKEIHRSLNDLLSDYHRYREEQSMKKGESSFLRNVNKYLQLNNLILFLQKAIFVNPAYKQELEPLIFHTFIKTKRELRKDYISKILLPLLRSFRQDQQLQAKIKQYEQQDRIDVSEQLAQSEEVSQVFQTPSPKKDKKMSRVKQQLKTQQNASKKKGIDSVMKQLQSIKRKKQIQKQKSMLYQRQKDIIQQKKQLYRSIGNQKRIVQFGKKNQIDVDYKNLHDIDSVKGEENHIGLPNFKLFNLDLEEESAYLQDFDSLMKKYRKVWRFLFFKYSSLGAKTKPQAQMQQKINIAQIWKMLKQYEFDIIRKQQSHVMVKKINQMMKRRNDLQNLTYLGFEQYLLQVCHFAYGRQGYGHVPPSRQLIMFLDQVKQVTASRGGSIQMFQNPDDVYFQQTEVIREFNRRLKQNSDYVLPEGYKKVKQNELMYEYQMSKNIKNVKPSYSAVMEVVDEIIWNCLKVHVIQPQTNRVEKCLARPVLFQKMKQKIKDYSGGYLLPKRSFNDSVVEKDVSPMKIQFHPLINFSLGIKLGLSGVDIKYKFIADEVAYWLDDALDAVQMGKNKVANKAKIRIQNDIIRRKRSSANQIKLQKIQLQKKQRIRAETVKHEAEKYRQNKKEIQMKSRRDQKLQRKKRKEREDLEMKKKIQQFQQAKAKLQAKKKEAQEKKQLEMLSKKKQKQDYKKNVEEYFQKKKKQLGEKEKGIIANRQWQAQQQIQSKAKQAEKKKRLQIQVFKKEEEVLQKIVVSKQSYQQAWKSTELQRELEYYRIRMKYFFNLLLKYQKSKISSTNVDEISFNTMNFFALKTMMIPILITKNTLVLLFKAAIKQPKQSCFGLSYSQYQEFMFKIAVKAKQTLNGPKKNIEQYEEEEAQLPTLKSSPEMERKNKKTLTDDYALDATGVRPQTYRKLMQFIDLPLDKQDAELRFRDMLQSKNSKPLSLILKQAKSYMDLSSS